MSSQNVADKFEIHSDLGIIGLPIGYKHAKCFSELKLGLNIGKVNIHHDLTDANFSNPSRVLHSEDRLHAYLFRQIPTGILGVTTTIEERMRYLARFENPAYPGAQGAAVVLKQKSHLLPKSMSCVSLDDKSHLWSDNVSFIFPYSNGEYEFGYLRQDYPWFPHHLFFGFFEVE